MRSQLSALERALPILAAAYGEQFGVDIVLSGTEAYTNGQTIYLPMLSADSQLKDVLFGYLAHESAHVRDSDFTTLTRCNTALEKFCTNIFEDIRIELVIQAAFPGTRFTLDTMWTHIVEQGMSPAASPEDNEASQLCQYLLHRLHAEVLQREASIPLAATSQTVLEQSFPIGFFVRLDALLDKYVPKLSCSDDCLALTRAVLKALQDAEQEEAEQSADSGQQSGQPGQSGANSSGEQDSQESGDDTQSDASNEQCDVDSEAGGDDGKNQQGGDGASLSERIADENDLPSDVIDTLRAQLVDQASQDQEGNYVHLDATSVGRDVQNNGDCCQLQAGILTSSTIRARLLGLLQAQSRERQWLHHRGKRVDGKRLARLSSGDSRVFIQRDELQRPDTAVHILLDSSGSMGQMQDVANQATVSLALAITSIPKCDIAVSMFPGNGGEVSPMLHRGQPVRATLGSFAVSPSGGTPLAEAMLYAARELAASRKPRKVLIIITDGAPNNAVSVRHMVDLLQPHVDMYAIGIGSHSVQRFFEKWTVINEVSELQQALFSIAGNFLDLQQ